MRIFLLFFFLLTTGSVGWGADFSDPPPRYEPAGGGFACVTRKEDFEKAEAEKRDACLRIGLVHVGMARTAVEAQLGKPVASMPAGTREAFVYGLQSNAAGSMTTYAICTYGDDGRALSLQLTGLPWPGDWRFAGLGLGASQQALEARLGPPKQIEKSDQPETVQWNYLPWTFSFEVRSGVVTSIRVAAE